MASRFCGQLNSLQNSKVGRRHVNRQLLKMNCPITDSRDCPNSCRPAKPVGTGPRTDDSMMKNAPKLHGVSNYGPPTMGGKARYLEKPCNSFWTREARLNEAFQQVDKLKRVVLKIGDSPFWMEGETTRQWRILAPNVERLPTFLGLSLQEC